MLNLTLRLLPLLAFLGFLAGPGGWLDDRGPRLAGGPSFVATNGMAIDPDGGPGGAPVIIDPADPGL